MKAKLITIILFACICEIQLFSFNFVFCNRLNRIRKREREKKKEQASSSSIFVLPKLLLPPQETLFYVLFYTLHNDSAGWVAGSSRCNLGNDTVFRSFPSLMLQVEESVACDIIG